MGLLAIVTRGGGRAGRQTLQKSGVIMLHKVLLRCWMFLVSAGVMENQNKTEQSRRKQLS